MEESSQVDLMATQLVEPSQEPSQPIPGSVGKMKHEYDKLVFFLWGRAEANERPFQVAEKKFFSQSEVRDDWVKFKMLTSSRTRKMKPLSHFPGQLVSLFAKMECGMLVIQNMLW